MKRNNIRFDFSLLQQRIDERFGNTKEFARALGVPDRILFWWLGNVRYWPRDAMINAVELLEIPEQEIDRYFFRRCDNDR